MWARVTRRPVSSDKLDATLDAYQNSMFPYITSQNGNLGALVLFDRETGDILTISMWADEASMNAVVAKRPTAVSEAAGNQGSEQIYEILVRK
jgi:heme-degrading monooxygenase HmoA